MDEEEYQYVEEELLKEHVYKYLKGMRYLVVIDDMWDTNVWDDLRWMFLDDLNGSRIIITTRELNVASYIDPLINPHHMRLMAVDQSWRFLEESVWTGKLPSRVRENRISYCRKMSRASTCNRCIAGVLSSKVNQNKDSWEKIARNVYEVVSTNDEQFTDILTLSYMYLPSRLRPFFLYMGCFREDYQFNVSKLIRLWVSEGFLTSNASKEMEELGYEYLEDLATRSLVLISKKG